MQALSNLPQDIPVSEAIALIQKTRTEKRHKMHLECVRRYNEKNHEELLRKKREYRESHREELARKNKEYRAAKKSQAVVATPAEGKPQEKNIQEE